MNCPNLLCGQPMDNCTQIKEREWGKDEIISKGGPSDSDIVKPDDYFRCEMCGMNIWTYQT